MERSSIQSRIIELICVCGWGMEGGPESRFVKKRVPFDCGNEIGGKNFWVGGRSLVNIICEGMNGCLGEGGSII